MIRIKPEQIEAWIARHFNYKSKKNGEELLICNPDGDKKFNLRISTVQKELKNRRNKQGKPLKNYWVNDFRINHQQYNGSFINFVRAYKNLTFFEAMKEVTGQSLGQLRRGLRRKKEEEKEPEPEDAEDFLSLPPGARPIKKDDETRAAKMAVAYLEKRRAISIETAIRNSLHYTATSVIFPYIEYGIMVYWQWRSTFDKVFGFPDEGKTGLAKTDFLYNFDNVEQPTDYIILVESIFNCLSIGDNCVATGGAKMSDEGKQIRKLKMLDPKVVILAPDHDEAGLKSLRTNYFLLKNDFNLACSIPPVQDEDWNDMDQRYGIGSARKYIENNTIKLNIATLSKAC
jgi:hypothetical protein